MEKRLKTTYGEVSYIDNGVSGPAILFIHGNSSCKEVFGKQFDSGLGSHFRLVAFDLPGHGTSFRADEPRSIYSMQTMAKVVKEVSELLMLDSPVLLGWSLGGHIAIEAVAQGFETKALVIVGTPPFGPGADGADTAFHPNDHMGLTGKECFDADDVRDYASSTLGGEEFVTEHLLAQVAGCDGRARQSILEDWSDPHSGHAAIPFVTNWKKPIAVIHGELDLFVQLDHLTKLHWGNLWRNEVQLIPASGHASFLQSPDHFNRLLSEFMATL